MTRSSLLQVVPSSLRDELFDELDSITTNYLEGRWGPTELSGGRFCEIVYTVLDGHARGVYPAAAAKPRDMVAACRALESNTSVPRSFQILIPRLLPALYEIRNNRGVGHVGGDVDSNAMDATMVVSIAKWIVAELIRVFHNMPVGDAQNTVDGLAHVTIPLVWKKDGNMRVLEPSLSIKDHIILLLVTNNHVASIADLRRWAEEDDGQYFIRTVRQLHRSRYVEFNEQTGLVRLLPPGGVYSAQIVAKQRSKKTDNRRK